MSKGRQIDKFSSIIEKVKKNKLIQYLIIGFLVVILLLTLFSSSIFDKSNKESESFSVDSYVEGLETRLSKVLSKVDGAGKVAVVITVESGMETVLATKVTTTTNSDGTERIETPIMVNGKTVVLKENYPKIIGVLIVAEGADSVITMSKLQNATVSLLDIKVNQIEILTMK